MLTTLRSFLAAGAACAAAAPFSRLAHADDLRRNLAFTRELVARRAAR
jgi:hypothetical protein